VIRNFFLKPKDYLISVTTMMIKGNTLRSGISLRIKLTRNGLYIADNVLWHGKVAVKNFVGIASGWTEAIMEQN